MRRIPIYRYPVFGYNYRLLRFHTDGIPVQGESSLVELTDEFFSFVEELDLPVTNAAAVELRQLRSEMEQIPEGTKVDAILANRVREAVNAVDRTLDAELGQRTAYVLTPKRFDLKNLTRNPDALLGKDVFQSIPGIARSDFRMGCLCIAFALPTAAAFHLMRATEAVLCHYFTSIVKRGRPRQLLWADMVDRLRKRRKAPPKPLLDGLDNIRHNFRNPTQHPEAGYDMDEAQDLLSVCIDAINRLIRDLPARSS